MLASRGFGAPVDPLVMATGICFSPCSAAQATYGGIVPHAKDETGSRRPSGLGW